MVDTTSRMGCERTLRSGMALVPIAALLWCGAAFAQANPSSDQILNSLMPKPGMTETTRGIRPIGPADTGTTAPAAPGIRRGGHPGRRSAETPDGAPAAPAVSLTVEFETGAATLTPDAVHTLDHLGQALSSPQLAGDRFLIEGHTDMVGLAAANLILSERRAQAVVAYLQSQFHLDPSRLEARGLGERGLLVQTGANVAEPRNRRVLVVNLGN